MQINWTVVISSAITAAVISMFQFLALRYFARAIEKVERHLHNGKKGE